MKNYYAVLYDANRYRAVNTLFNTYLTSESEEGMLNNALRAETKY
jgi:hypothetical protein